MDIKQMLRRFNIKLVDFADVLMVSRPTLNTYIRLFENGDLIPNDKYQRIFENLFISENLDKDQFERKLRKYQNLLIRDNSFGVKDLDINKTNLISMIIKKMKEDIASGDYDEEIYVFINFLISSYHEEDGFKKLIDYFLYLNDIKKIENVRGGEKVFLSNCYRVMRDEVEHKLYFDEYSYDEFVDRIYEIRKKKAYLSEKIAMEKEDIIKTLINKKLKHEIQEQLKLGVDVGDIDMNQIMNNIDLNDIKSMLNKKKQ